MTLRLPPSLRIDEDRAPELERRIDSLRWRWLNRGRFPVEAARVVNGIGLASWDESVERCLGTFLSPWAWTSKGCMETIARLRRLADQADIAIPALSGEAAAYFKSLREMIGTTLLIAADFRPDF